MSITIDASGNVYLAGTFENSVDLILVAEFMFYSTGSG
jgi:hypothetical protein